MPRRAAHVNSSTTGCNRMRSSATQAIEIANIFPRTFLHTSGSNVSGMPRYGASGCSLLHRGASTRCPPATRFKGHSCADCRHKAQSSPSRHFRSRGAWTPSSRPSQRLEILAVSVQVERQVSTNRTRQSPRRELGRRLFKESARSQHPISEPTRKILLLTLERRGALARAEWSEFHFAEKEWHVPAEHDKMRRAHIVPLTDWAITELKALQALSKGSRFVLPKRRGDRPSSPQLISRSVIRT